MQTSSKKPTAATVVNTVHKGLTGGCSDKQCETYKVVDPVCKHVWSRDYIDLTPDRSMPVWSCHRCHEIRETRP